MQRPTPDEETLIRKLDGSPDDVVRVTKELVRFKSTNPPGDESEIAEYVYSFLNALGMSVRKVETGEKRVNVIGKLEGSPPVKGRRVIFNGHMDVVPVADLDQWTVDPFEAQLREGMLIGRGTNDMKGAIASCLVATKALIDAGTRIDGALEIQTVADEENGSKYGTRALIEKGMIRGDMAIVMEGSVFNGRIHVRTAVRGLHWIEIKTKGRAIHGSMPGHGVNAVLKMSKILLALDKYPVKHKPHRLLPTPTLSAGTMISAGVRENVIPPYCTATLDLRVLPGMSEEDNLMQMRSVIQELAREDKELEAEVRTRFWWPAGEIDENQSVVKLAKEATELVAGYPLEPKGAPGSNDSTFINSQTDVPAIAFGPGDVMTGQAHGADERVSVKELRHFSKIYAIMALRGCGHTM